MESQRRQKWHLQKHCTYNKYVCVRAHTDLSSPSLSPSIVAKWRCHPGQVEAGFGWRGKGGSARWFPFPARPRAESLAPTAQPWP